MLLPLWMNNALSGGVSPTLVPNVVGLSQNDAIAAMEIGGYDTMVVSLVYNVLTPYGLIAGQFPSAGTPASTNTVVFLFESIGPSADQVKVH